MESKIFNNKDHQDLSDRKFRRTLNTTIINNFLDLNEVALDCSTLSNFFHHMRNSFEEIPHIFVSHHILNCCKADKELRHCKHRDEDKISLAFTEWLIMWLLTILSNQSVREVHSECQSLLVLLLKLIKTSGIGDFRRIILCLHTFLSNLNDFVEELIEYGTQDIVVNTLFQSNELKSTKLDKDLNLVDTPLILSTPEECEDLQEKITSIVTILMPEITQLLSDQCNSFCKIFCTQIKCGDLNLKRASLEAVTSLINTASLMLSSHQFDYILCCAHAMLDLCGTITEPLPDDFDSLEKATASCLKAIVTAAEKIELKFVLNTFMLRKFLLTLMEVLLLPRFPKTNLKFRNAIIDGIIHLIRCGDRQGFSIPKNLLIEFKAKLMKTFLCAENPKVLIPLFVHLIISEHYSNLNKFVDGTSYSENHGPVQKIMRCSKLFALMHGDLMSIVQHSGSTTKTNNFNIVCSCICILLQSLIEIKQNKDIQFQVVTVPIVNAPETLLSPKVLDYLCFLIRDTISSFPEFLILYKVFISMSECILACQDILSLSVEQLKIVCNLVSLPWCSNSEILNLQDLYYNYISPQSMIFMDKEFPETIKMKCLKCLCYMPSNICPNWRQQVFIQCLQDSEAIIRTCFLRQLSFSHALIIPHVLSFTDLRNIILKETSIEVLHEVANLVGKLSCVFSYKCSVIRLRDSDGFFSLIPQVTCGTCAKLQICKGDINSSFPEESPEFLSKIFVHVLSHPSVSVRKGAISSITSYFSHNEMSENVLLAIINLITDSSSAVRNKLSQVISDILKPSGCNEKTRGWLPKMEELVIMKLRAALLTSKSSENVDLQKTVVITIGELGKFADNGLLLITIISLLESYVTTIPSVKNIAGSKLKEIASSKNYKMHELFKIYKEPICKFLAETMSTYSLQDLSKSLSTIEETGAVFGYGDIKSFMHHTQRYILPYLICKETESSSELLTSLSKILHVQKSNLLINNFSFIFSYFVCNCTKAELEKALLFIQKETNLELGSLLRCNYQPIHNELLLQLSTHYDQVFNGLAILALKSGNLESINHMIINSEDMANYLQPKLLGFLVFFDAQMLKSTLDEKKMALNSLVSIMELMGNRAITAVRFKLMATLRIALRFKEGDFPRICCTAWNTFVHSIDITCLGPLLNQIIVALLPLLPLETVPVTKILQYLIIEQRVYLSEFFHDLYFVPDIPELQEINFVLKEYNENPSSLADFHSLLCHSLRGVSHENLEVRLYALEKLKQVLHENQLSIREHLLCREDVDNLLSNLVAGLIAGCREPDVKIRVLLGECLGELGAVDPGRLDMKSASSKETLANFYKSIEDEDFAFALIQELVHSFLAADECRIQDCSACAIQEVLRLYKCSNERGTDSQLWKMFQPDIQEILAVLFHSQYKPLEKSQKKFPVPIYQSKMGNTFKEWTKNWFYSLLQKVKKDIPFKLFHSCSIIIKYDLNCTLFLIPHLVVYALLDSNEEEAEEICSEILAVLNHSEQVQSLSDLNHLCSQTAFSVFDHLSKWTYHKLKLISSDTSLRSTDERLSQDPGYSAINKCLKKIPQILLANSAFSCKAYTRALMHLEQHIKEHPHDLENNIGFLQKIYAALDEPDSVAGVAAIRREEPSLMDLILENEAMGDMQAAFTCYEKAIKLYPDEVNHYGGLLKCFLGMDQPTTALRYANGVLNERPEWEDKLNFYRIEAAWKLASWDGLEHYLHREDQSSNWAVGVGQILHHAHKRDLQSYEEQLKRIRTCQMAPLSAASMEKGSYLRGYEYLTRMHMLTDLQQSVKLFFNLDALREDVSKKSLFMDTLCTLNLRRLLVQSSPRYQEPTIDLHRVLLKIGTEKNPEFSALFNKEIANCWLQSAKLARKCGHQQRAHSCLLEAGIVNSPDFFMEKTKWHWNKGEKEQAIFCLQKGIEEHFSTLISSQQSYNSMVSKDQLMCAKAKLLLAVYSEESSIVETSTLMNMYREVISLQPEWEESHFHFAKYYDKVLITIEKPEIKAEISVCIVENFGTSLKFGCKHVYHSLPRLLDIWFDLGTQVTQFQSSRKSSTFKSISSCLDKLTKSVIKDLHEALPMYLFLTALPQMVSRICHSYQDISVQLQKIIAKLLAQYSQQSMWMLMAVSKSSYPMRSRRCKEIFQHAILHNPSLIKFIQDTTRLADKLIELSNKNIGDCNVLSISEQYQILPKLVEDRNFSQIILPLQTQMIVTLPNGFLCNSDHQPFPVAPVYIRGFQDTVEVFPSLQKPKKLVVKGSDGKLYPIMCKPKDDLRKDCRLMEFNNLVNRYLRSDPEARRRQLYIRTYAVIPLNEECGLIEWVPNLSGLRLILCRLYKLKGLQVNGRDIRVMMPPKMATAQQKLHSFKNKFLPKFPPVFYDWFLITFPDPTAWYLARLAYARTTAVMSMVGYIIGLGDRHGENILFDSSCGDTVHVDLNCLFNKGETMECPECVPFRLTHNMVDAMGPSGYEGAFRKSCEVTMRVMRSKTDALMSVLRPFVHDPLVEWSRNKMPKAHSSESGEISNEQGLTHVKDIELRLNGIIKEKNKQRGLPLSIEGQVNHLIKEATDLKNLSQMYIGWAAYM